MKHRNLRCISVRVGTGCIGTGSRYPTLVKWQLGVCRLCVLSVHRHLRHNRQRKHGETRAERERSLSVCVWPLSLTREAPLQQALQVGDVLKTSHHLHLHLRVLLLAERVHHLQRVRVERKHTEQTLRSKKNSALLDRTDTNTKEPKWKS